MIKSGRNLNSEGAIRQARGRQRSQREEKTVKRRADGDVRAPRGDRSQRTESRSKDAPATH
jgi:hypothetical protein